MTKLYLHLYASTRSFIMIVIRKSVGYIVPMNFTTFLKTSKMLSQTCLRPHLVTVVRVKTTMAPVEHGE